MSSGQILIVLCVASVDAARRGRFRRVGIPAPVVLVVAGLIIGFLPFVPDVSLHPEVVLLGLLPLLVFDAALTSSPTAFRRDARSIGTLAVLLVVVTALGVAAMAHWVGHLPWPISFVLGTAVGPTDAAAATSVARRIGLPRRLLTILEGEALFNDATALVLYAEAVTAATTGEFSVIHTLGSIVYATVVGAAIGLAVGFIGRSCATGSMTRRWRLPVRSSSPTSLTSRPRRSTPRGSWRRLQRGSTWAGTTPAGPSRPAAGCSRMPSGRPWSSWSTPPCSSLVGLSFHTFSVQARGPLGRLVLTGRGGGVGRRRAAPGVDVGVRLDRSDPGGEAVRPAGRQGARTGGGNG